VEKIAYQLWKKDSDSLEIFKNKLLLNLAKDVSKLVSELQINIADADVALASNLVQSNYSPSPNAIIFVKVKSYFSSGEIELQLDKVTKKIEGFVVSESIILENEKKNPSVLDPKGLFFSFSRMIDSLTTNPSIFFVTLSN
jgi:ABC-type phosphate transport system substrate-binding protein